MELDIRYCTTSDGASIAYATRGEGPPMLYTSSFLPFSRRLADPLPMSIDDALTPHFSVTHYDGRGMGLSDHDARDYSLDARAKDLLAVAEAVGARRFRLWGELYGAPTALSVAARHPERVERLVVMGAYAVGRRLYDESEFGRVAEALRNVTAEQWAFVSEALVARGGDPDTPPDVLKRRAEVMRDA
jgi:pimeloyl-ACP methyl ester carboxylesterase